MQPFLLGITGGIGSGKSCVSRLLASYCLAPLIDVDQCCRHLLDIDQPGWLALRAAFGNAFLRPSGELDRVALRERLFSEPQFRQQVDGLLHPLARAAMHRAVASHRHALILVEVPLLYEAGWDNEMQAVLVVYARRGVQCCRIMQRDGVSRHKAAQAVAAQMDLREKAKRADYCIDNSGAWTRTRLQVIALGDKLSECFPV
ncbi:dephospho-CoA kinase [Desulfobulbus propionicus DSM 2032]|uniref:Dephospho-CoA kinase n=1 Tax=Desulfobulbus propionicus (strain ATCC 33891 / DSM 2032 / VKM B-1956 / 1pr3) TaxID=577650 RepID=A0A7U4DPX2_DESPD|nr:dephospho-CoA kinase [Desulfobulbus propionicus]ADW18616.1 dephospho-CoA kinase [Desulfobulbus propionicus DSM 2032]